MKKAVSIFLVFALFMAGIVIPERMIANASGGKTIVIKSINRNTLQYYDACSNTELNPNVDWSFETTVGYGSVKKSKLSSKTKFYLLKNQADPMGGYKKVKKKIFMKRITEVSQGMENGISFYYGFACVVYKKSGKCIKLKELFMA